MRALLVALTVAVGLFAAADLFAATSPSLRAVGFAPLTVAGRGFAPGERVTLTLYGGGRQISRAVAGATGGFTARFAVAQPRCSAWIIRAVGSRNHRLWYPGPVQGCDPPVSAGAAAPAGAVGIAGVVRRGPTTPVCTSETPCTAPVAGVAVDVLQGDVRVARVVTGADGRYYVLVAPGDYVVRAVGARRLIKPVRVAASRLTEVDFLIDTRIR